jgi:bifunctional DNA-binding transcriptional regulator/antitoxin component of YhaV-PrlF toxin-antitoxin module
MVAVNHQGEIKIPPHLLGALGIKPGTEVEVEQLGDALIIRTVKAGARSICSQVEDGPKILEYRGPTVTLEEMEEAIVKGIEESL